MVFHAALSYASSSCSPVGKRWVMVTRIPCPRVSQLIFTPFIIYVPNKNQHFHLIVWQLNCPHRNTQREEEPWAVNNNLVNLSLWWMRINQRAVQSPGCNKRTLNTELMRSGRRRKWRRFRSLNIKFLNSCCGSVGIFAAFRHQLLSCRRRNISINHGDEEVNFRFSDLSLLS